MKSLSILCLFVALSVANFADEGAKMNPNNLRSQILAGTVSPHVSRSLRLTCTDRPSASDLTYVELRKNERYGVLQVYGTMCDNRDLVLFRATKAGWEFTQTLPLPTLLGTQPVITFPDLLGDGSHEVVAMGQLVDHGTGVDQKNMTIYKLIGNRMEVVFDAPESVHVQEPSGDKQYSLEQHSVFEFVANPESNSNEHMIHEVQTVVQETKTVVRHRSCIWNSEIIRFRCYEQAP